MSAALDVEEPDYIEQAIAAVQAIPRRSGQQTVFTPKAIRKLLEALERGHFIEPACAYAGVSYRTFRRWMAEGQDDDTESTPQFAMWQAAQQAQAIWENAALGRLDDAAKAAPRYFMADVIRLSRRHRNRWSEQTKDAPQINVGIAFGVMGGPGAPPAIAVSPVNQHTLERKPAESLVITPTSHNAHSVNQG